MARCLALLAPFLLLAGCFGLGPAEVECGPRKVMTFEGDPMSHMRDGGFRDDRHVWMWMLPGTLACAEQTVVVEGEVHVAPAPSHLAGCPEGGATATLSSSAGPVQGAMHEGTPVPQGNLTTFGLRSEINLREANHPVGVLAILQVTFPMIEDREKAEACAVERLKLVRMQFTYLPVAE